MSEGVKCNVEQSRILEFTARGLLVFIHVAFIESVGPSPKILVLVFGSILSMAISSGETFQIRGLLPFLGSFNMMRFFSVLRNVRRERVVSAGLMS
jgi:hypothetical protein